MGAGSDQFPRVLVISPNVLNPGDGGGVLMGNLFAGWPRDRIADIYSQWWIAEKPEICAHYYRLPSRLSGRVAEWPRRLREYLTGRSESLDGMASFRMTKRLDQWIRQFAPQIVYSHLGPLWLTRLTNQVVRRFHLPLVVHINDDYISDWPVNGHEARRVFPLAQILHALNERQFLASLSLAKARLAVSELMRQEYVRRYGLEFEVFTNGVDPAVWPGGDLPDRNETSRCFTLLYAGSIAANTNLTSLLDVAGVVSALAARNVRIRFVVTRPTDSRVAAALEAAGPVSFVEPVPHEKMPSLLAEADLLLLPFNFDEGSVSFIRYSWPTKMPEFMISGRPILLYGPRHTAFGEYARRANWARVVDERDPSRLAAALEDLMGSPQDRRVLVDRARALVLQEQDLRKTRCRFQDMIRRVAS